LERQLQLSDSETGSWKKEAQGSRGEIAELMTERDRNRAEAERLRGVVRELESTVKTLATSTAATAREKARAEKAEGENAGADAALHPDFQEHHTLEDAVRELSRWYVEARRLERRVFRATERAQELTRVPGVPVAAEILKALTESGDT
jgi:DNA repair exonuclease SbcCD ATPase subunit